MLQIALIDFLKNASSPLQIPNVDTWSIISPLCKAVVTLQEELHRLPLNPKLKGNAISSNSSGDQQKKFDLFANEVFKTHFQDCANVAGMVSEEEEAFVAFDFDRQQNAFVIQLDPIDGSANMEINHPTGTIFSFYPKKSSAEEPVQSKDFLQRGDQQVLAGYLMFGSSTLLILTTGNGVFGFLYDRNEETFFLAYDKIKIPENGKIICTNERDRPYWEQRFRDYPIDWKTPNEGGNTMASRSSGAFFADVHRCLFSGGIYFRPATSTSKEGKLRLLYECNPMAFILEQAGGEGDRWEPTYYGKRTESYSSKKSNHSWLKEYGRRNRKVKE